MAKKTGKAYAFFDCKASKQSIEELLPHIRESVKTPNALELSLMEDIGTLTGAYQSQLYERGEQFRGEVVYKEKGSYMFRE